MAKKIQLQDANGNVLHPLTLGECVAMDSGENLDTLMSKSQMFTPTITQDKSMFKVGTGVDVDYSANVKDGAYESLVFKGKSLVNLSNLHKSFNDVTLSGYYADTSLCETSKLKLGTPYTLVFYTTVHGGDHDIYNTIELGVGNALHGTDAHPKTTTNHRGTLVKNGWSMVCVTFTDFLGYKYLSLRPIRCNAPESGKSIRFSIEGFILLEGDWSNKDLPFNDYFDGIGYCKMPILRNVGKNLCDTSKYIHGGLSNNNMIFSKNKYRSYYMKCKPSTVYTVKVENSNNRFGVGSSHLFSEDTAFTLNKYWTTPSSDVTGQTLQHTVTTAEKDKYLYVYVANNGVFSPDIRVQVEEAPSPTSYEPYKTNILRTPEEIVLREVNGVQDTYNAITGEYVKRIGEIVLDGSESEWHKYSNNTNEYNTTDKTSVFSISINDKKLGYHTSICDTFRNTNNNYAFNMSYVEPFTYSDHPTNTSCYFDYGNNNSYTVADFKTWLSQNPVTIHYELAEPITTIVKPSTMTPFAYQNGHVIVESGHEGQSLLPEIEYSVVTGRTGQVTQNTKVLRQQEQQIIGLEELLLTQVVQMEYERTLLQFDYELQMMMLG